MSTKATRSPKTVAGYRSILDTIVLPRWRDIPLQDVRYDDLQVWISGLSSDGSVRFEGKGLSASRVRQAHQLVGAVLKFAVRAKHLPANPADGVELPRLPESEQRYLTHEQLHRVAVASGRLNSGAGAGLLRPAITCACCTSGGRRRYRQVPDADTTVGDLRPKDRPRGGANEEPHLSHGAGAQVFDQAAGDGDSGHGRQGAGISVGSGRWVPDSRPCPLCVSEVDQGCRWV